ncbi:MAG: hypothetical protein KDA67_02985 [Rhodobacteraceae bacterium]|nr:hypothetical protein [Paracoccaceae bacterium]
MPDQTCRPHQGLHGHYQDFVGHGDAEAYCDLKSARALGRNIQPDGKRKERR